MTDYSELVKALRYCGNFAEREGCAESCEYFNDMDCPNRIMSDAAAAIEELDAEETRLLLITSELQDKVVELEEELNDGDVAADDNAWQIEELQAEVKRLELDNEDYEHEHRRLKGEIEALQAQLPKQGEWELIDGAEPMRWGCSRCKYLSWETSSYCPRCGAKMEVQE